MNTAFVNGTFTDTPSISPYDLGFLRGCGVFESFRTYDKAPLFLNRRLKRLRFSAEEIGIDIPYSDQEIAEVVQRLIEENGFAESQIRIIATKGISHEGLFPEEGGSLYILTQLFNPFPDSYYHKGIRLATTPASRQMPHIKTLNYLPGLLSLEEAKILGTSEILYVDSAGNLLEGCTSNFFGIQNEILYTAGEGVLPGITREIVLSAVQNHFDVSMTPVHKRDIASLDEAFVTSSLKEVVPVVSIDETPIGTGKPGPHTEIVLDLFRSALFELSLN